MSMRVAIVNDLAMAREALRRALQSTHDVTVAWTAADGAEAISKAKSDRPDLILMDLIMPGVDGVEATREIMRQCPCAIVVVTATVEGNASRVYEALGAGALDAVDTPHLSVPGGAAPLLQKIEAVRRMRAGGERLHPPTLPGSKVARPGGTPSHPSAGAAPGSAAPAFRDPCADKPCPEAHRHAAPPLVLIGASTGGPQALAAVLMAMPAAPPFAVLIVQHMEPVFLRGLATWLQTQIKRPVRLARSGEVPEPGAVLVAGEAKHLVVVGKGMLCYTDEPRELIHRPSVDVLFQSAAAAPVQPGVAVLLTGMGRDGARGLLELRSRGWTTIAQDEATSVVWGMPGAARELGAAERVLPLGCIGHAAANAIADKRAPHAGGTT
ncbi:MAG: chemotaxis-specific protein-glutamate methyltransferase CheB [Phycisphaerales bacterium]